MERVALTKLTAAAENGPAGRNWAADWLRPTVFAVLSIAVIVLLAWAVKYAVNSYHDRIALSGKSGDIAPVTFVIAGEALSIPANMIRFPGVRAGGGVDRIDLLLHWPSLEGFSEDRVDAFRDGSTLAPLIYVTIAPRDNPLDADTRLDTIYRRYFTGEAIPGPSGLTGRRMSGDSAYRGEIVYYAKTGPARFAARCLAEASAEVPATCMRDVNIGTGLSMRYRIDRFYLGDWQALDSELKTLVAGFISRR